MMSSEKRGIWSKQISSLHLTCSTPPSPPNWLALNSTTFEFCISLSFSNKQNKNQSLKIYQLLCYRKKQKQSRTTNGSSMMVTSVTLFRTKNYNKKQLLGNELMKLNKRNAKYRKKHVIFSWHSPILYMTRKMLIQCQLQQSNNVIRNNHNNDNNKNTFNFCLSGNCELIHAGPMSPKALREPGDWIIVRSTGPMRR